MIGTTLTEGSRPTSVAEAAMQLDRLGRHCMFNCDRADACVEEDCAAWRQEQAAAEYLAATWIAAED